LRLHTRMVPSELPLQITSASGRYTRAVIFSLGLSVIIFLAFPSSGCFNFFRSFPVCVVLKLTPNFFQSKSTEGVKVGGQG